MSFMFLFSFSFVLGANAITLNTPAASASISGTTYILNGTLDTNTINITNATFYYKIDSGSWVEIGSVVNTTVGQLNYTYSWDTSSIVDTSNMTFNISAINTTGVQVTTDTSTGVLINNGVPTATYASTSLATATQLYLDTSFTFAVDADNTIGIENCTYYIGSTTKTVTASGEACSTAYTPSSFGVTTAGDYSYLITVTDDNGNQTNTSSRTIQIYGTNTNSGSGGTGIIQSVDNTPTNIDATTGTGAGAGTTTTESNVFVRFFSAIGNFFTKLFTWNW